MSNILVLGKGGREHTLVWKLTQSPQLERVYCAPGNPGIGETASNVDLDPDNYKTVSEFAKKNDVGLVVPGGEDPLCDGIVDELSEEGVKTFGPLKKAAGLERSKAFAKSFMERNGIPTADYKTFDRSIDAKKCVEANGAPIVVKADGLAAGKGVSVCSTTREAYNAIDTMMVDRKFGESGDRIVLEDKLGGGEEASVLALTDGHTVLPLISSQDHKPVYDGDKGPNTGGMGAYAPAPVVTDEVMQKVKEQILQPTVDGMRNENNTFVGCLYAGLMIQNGEPSVVEYNVRFGDPEAQVVLPMLGNDLYELMDACVEGRLHEYEINNHDGSAACVVMASGGYPGKYEKGYPIEISDALRQDDEIQVFHAGTKIKHGKLVTDGGRVLGVTGWGEDIQGAIDKAYKGVSGVDFMDMHYRNDIGQKALDKGR